MHEVGAEKSYYIDDLFFNRLVESNDFEKFFVVAVFNNKVIGLALILEKHGVYHYHLSCAVSRFLKLNPNNLMRDALIEKLAGNPSYRIIFGGGRTSELSDSLLKFKLSFSSSTLQYYRCELVFNPKQYELLSRKWESSADFNKKKKFGNRIFKFRY